jgi:NAD(P)-dependent dehydrogenase (short-subunit alcohol dehydrogenase family)
MAEDARVAVVIGGGSGLGAVSAAVLAADGCRVVTADLAGADRVVDVTDESSVAALRAAWLTGATIDLNGGAHLRR